MSRRLVEYLHKLPRPFVRWLRDCWLGLLDLRDRLLFRRDDLTPPRRLHYVGGGDFKASGQEFLGHFVQVGGLKPGAAVLDIGCGTGRMAIPLLQFLDGFGSYIGFDISCRAIRWCRDRITSRNPRFSFIHADIRNLEYNPRGKLNAAKFVFPCDDRSIDFAFATSVFTHLLPDDVEQYLAEIRRVLRPTGRALLTWFVLDETAQRDMTSGKGCLNFNVKLPRFSTIDRQTPERAIAYPEPHLLEFLQRARLALVPPIHYGSWSGRSADCLTMQDVVVVERAEPDNL
jgi:ubiquinone/menaquinone biosynthesis C-methylase UbiE